MFSPTSALPPQTYKPDFKEQHQTIAQAQVFGQPRKYWRAQRNAENSVDDKLIFSCKGYENWP
jgi:hypothetical protein